MTIKLISLVIITLFLLSGHSYSEDQFLFPKKNLRYLKAQIIVKKLIFLKIYHKENHWFKKIKILKRKK